MAISNDHDALVAQAEALIRAHNYEEAITVCDRGLMHDPNSAECLFQRSVARARLDQYEFALSDLETALYINPNLKFLADTDLYLRARVCRWANYAEKVDSVLQHVDAHQAVRPYHILAIPSLPSQQLNAASSFFLDSSPPDEETVSSALPANGKIRLGYFSADFYDHAISHLINGMFEVHDRSRFEIIAFALGGRNDPVRNLMIEVSDQLIDVSGMSDEQVVFLARQLGIHIGIDMNIYLDRQPNIFARRVAPIQVNYLGYPGTAGTNCYDYIIGDRMVTPPEHNAYFAERVVTMPHSYQATSLRRYTEFRPFTKHELGLPETGFVFCSFNLSFKITPDVFDIWMRLLTMVEGSVLWLLSSNPAAEQNLKQEAEKRNVSRDRLIFAPRMPLADHLARHRAADLFLDTFHYGGHTTTSDSLWAGLPVITRLGVAFAGRVAASLLSAAGLPDLIAQNSGDYEKLALDLATRPETLARIKSRLASNKRSCPLFDTERYTRNIESAYTEMWNKHELGLGPENITVTEEEAR